MLYLSSGWLNSSPSNSVKLISLCSSLTQNSSSGSSPLCTLLVGRPLAAQALKLYLTVVMKPLALGCWPTQWGHLLMYSNGCWWRNTMLFFCHQWLCQCLNVPFSFPSIWSSRSVWVLTFTMFLLPWLSSTSWRAQPPFHWENPLTPAYIWLLSANSSPRNGKGVNCLFFAHLTEYTC